jgi:hypothetical protein
MAEGASPRDLICRALLEDFVPAMLQQRKAG